MAKQVWTVRVIQTRTHDGAFLMQSEAAYSNIGTMLEQLRYMGWARELAELDAGEENTPGKSWRRVIEFDAPPKVDSRIWAEQNAARMRSFGFNAVAAPKWDNTASEHRLGVEFPNNHRLPTSSETH